MPGNLGVILLNLSIKFCSELRTHKRNHMAEMTTAEKLKAAAEKALAAAKELETTEAPVVESVQTESLKTKASSGSETAEERAARIAKELRELAHDLGADEGGAPTEAPVVESVQTESLKTKASSGR